jgi:hypothetical protein
VEILKVHGDALRTNADGPRRAQAMMECKADTSLVTTLIDTPEWVADTLLEAS